MPERRRDSLRLLMLWIAATALSTASGAAAGNGKRILALLQNADSKAQYSIFFGSLQQQGFQVDVRGVKDTNLRLREYDTWLFDHMVIFAPATDSFGGSIDTSALLEFVDSGRNLLMAVNSDVSETLRNLAAEMGVDLDDKGTKLFDHFEHADPSDHTLIASSYTAKIPAIVSELQVAPILFRGIAQVVPPESTLVTVALSAPQTAYSHDPRKAMLEPPNLVAGPAAALVTAVQARNNARVVVAGSLELFSDALINAEVRQGGQRWPKSGNSEFTLSVARWAFQDSGVLTAENLRHHIIGSEEQPSQYRVSDEVEVLLDIYEFNGGKRTPYKADDIQVEFTMLDPHIRIPLQHDGEGTFSARFKVPDVYGVFKYSIDYAHAGYSYIKLVEQVPVRPFRHDEYERFLVCAYPYYASAVSTMVAFLLLGVFFLYHK